ncbi:DUF349 domain-containing protein [Brachybacterium sp. JHP9]|uniref:DUF349 domain-containing protein n=1 Tax=Brachybacterium equifaecis TaxID=2910770 RepID=A0ABT0R0Q5_9MICO|nr:DUF349 domain-containing protein [Brachybacterium equifaecis]
MSENETPDAPATEAGQSTADELQPAAETSAQEPAAGEAAVQEPAADGTAAEQQPAAEDSAAQAGAAPAAPRPAQPRRPGPPSPAALAGRKPAVTLIPVAPPVQSYADADVEAALAFGEIDEDGSIIVLDGTQKRVIGTAAGEDRAQALTPLAHAYLDLVAFLDVTEQRLAVPDLTQADLNRLLENLRKNLKEPKAIGDIPALRTRAADLREVAKARIQALESERVAQREEAAAGRTAFVESIEALVATDPDRMSWKSAGETMREMVPTWKSMQKDGPALDRATEDALWKRLSAARSAFDRKRRAFFSQIDEQHGEAEKVKEDIIRRAEALQGSTDWGPTVREYRSLMDEWKAAPRGNRKKDDAQWARFKAAQDTFFAARNEDLHASDAEQQENLTLKEKLLEQAEAIDLSKGLDAAKAALGSIQDAWEAAGKVPRAAMRRIEDRLRAVERSVKQAEDDEWRRTDPSTRARVEGASSQLHSAIASYEEDLEKARKSGDPAKIAKAEEALRVRREWLEVIERSKRDLG